MPLLWEIFISFLVLFTLTASIRLGLKGYIKFPKNKVLNFITTSRWCYSLIIFIPWLLGEFARAEISAFPWIAFIQSSSKHGLYDRIFSGTIVLLVDLWLFWIPSNIWINKHEDIDKQKRIMVRIINLLVGLILITASNPIYKLLESGGP